MYRDTQRPTSCAQTLFWEGIKVRRFEDTITEVCAEKAASFPDGLTPSGHLGADPSVAFPSFPHPRASDGLTSQDGDGLWETRATPCIRQWLEIRKQKSEREKYMKLGRVALPLGILGCWLPSPPLFYQASVVKGPPSSSGPGRAGGLLWLLVYEGWG